MACVACSSSSDSGVKGDECMRFPASRIEPEDLPNGPESIEFTISRCSMNFAFDVNGKSGRVRQIIIASGGGGWLVHGMRHKCIEFIELLHTRFYRVGILGLDVAILPKFLGNSEYLNVTESVFGLGIHGVALVLEGDECFALRTLIQKVMNLADCSTFVQGLAQVVSNGTSCVDGASKIRWHDTC